MIRHIFTTAMKPETTNKQIVEIITALRSLNGKIAGMSKFYVGKNLGWYDEKAQIVLCADFSSKADWETYMRCPEHLRIGEQYMQLFDKDSMVVTQIEI